MKDLWRIELESAADAMEHRGHVRETLETADGRVCLFGALNLAMMGSALRWPSDQRKHVAALSAVTGVKDRGGDYHLGLVDWNNAFARTQSEVTGALRAAAKVELPS